MGKLLDLIFPENLYCCCCGEFIDKSRRHGICDICIAKINWTLDTPKCFDANTSYADGIFSCCLYGFYPRKIIYSLKLQGKPYIAKGIGLMMAERIMLEKIPFDLIIPVPMSKEKMKTRGFNQAELLSEYISRETKIKIDSSCLIKQRETGSMRLSNAKERSFNLDGVFAVTDKDIISGKTILLADDVVTTGTTLNECARVLKENGAARVYAITFAC